MIQTNSHIEISKSALANNIAFIRNIIGEGVVYSSVVKGNAYGHGIEVFCPLAYLLGVRHFSTFCAFEAHRVLNAVNSPDIQIMIMGAIHADQMAWAIENDIEFYVFNIDRLNYAIKYSTKVGKKAKIHLEFETGMNRTGFDSKELKQLHNFIEKNKDQIEVKGICSHMAGAESISNYKRIKTQIKRFDRIRNSVSKWDVNGIQSHMACSAATLSYPKHIYDLARVGILQYGFFPSEEVHIQYVTKTKTNINPLQRVISWKTNIMEIKNIKVGEFVGYGTSYFTNSAKKIALIPIGYSSGFSRSLSNSGKVIIRGARLDVVGMVNMNIIAVDISILDNAEIGDEVVIIGKQGETEITVSSFSDFSRLVNYELLTRLPQNINRIITE